ncbi:MAG: DUF1015 domain-containing protein [Clostridia bacterium]|nr:DUF1015 domain-containing protein [Clostridia bacterium]
MRTCIRIPRIFIPDGGFEKWAVIACDQFTSDKGYWERVKKFVGDEPSTLNFILPEAFLGEDDEERIEEIHENMYRALEQGHIVKLNRGMVLVARKTNAGVRHGIVTAIDLEAYTTEAGVVSPVRSSEAVVPSRLPARVAVRRGAPLEFPHAILFYRDKRRRLVNALLREDLEEIYDFDLMEDGGHITGYFISVDLAEEVAQELQSGSEPYFAVADGNHSVAAAKAYWDEIKDNLSAEEKRNHPARFTLVELVNLYDDAVVFHPIHRLVKKVDEAAFCDYLTRQLKCRQIGSVLYPSVPASGEGVRLTDEAIERYVRQNGGKIDYIHGDDNLAKFARQEGCVGVALRPIEKDSFFEQLSGGKNFPKKTFSVGEDKEKRYYVEGKEISYD